MIDVVHTQEDFYLRHVFKTVALLGRPDLETILQHVNFGNVMGMSPWLGNVKLLSTAEMMGRMSSAWVISARILSRTRLGLSQMLVRN